MRRVCSWPPWTFTLIKANVHVMIYLFCTYEFLIMFCNQNHNKPYYRSINLSSKIIKLIYIYDVYNLFAVIYNNRIFIFGGYNGKLDTHFNDLHCFDPTTNVWRLVRTHGTPPKARRRQSCLVIGRKMFLFGGTW